MQVSEGKHLFLQDFLCHLYFFDFEYHAMRRSCTVRVDHILPVKNYEVHVLISLKACYNNFNGRILKKTIVI